MLGNSQKWKQHSVVIVLKGLCEKTHCEAIQAHLMKRMVTAAGHSKWHQEELSFGWVLWACQLLLASRTVQSNLMLFPATWRSEATWKLLVPHLLPSDVRGTQAAPWQTCAMQLFGWTHLLLQIITLITWIAVLEEVDVNLTCILNSSGTCKILP